MKPLSRFIHRLFGYLAGHRRDADIAEEFELHSQLQTEGNIRRGLTPDKARREAVLKFRAIDSAKERYRDQRGLPWLETILSDCQFAVRMLRKNLTFTVAAIL